MTDAINPCYFEDEFEPVFVENDFWLSLREEIVDPPEEDDDWEA